MPIANGGANTDDGGTPIDAARCIDSLAELCALKIIKEKIEAGTASVEQERHYETEKDAAWNRAFERTRLTGLRESK